MEKGELSIGSVVQSMAQCPTATAANLGRELIEQHRKLIHAILGAIADERRAHVEEQLKQDKRAHALRVKV
jgi:hypothetical protein